MLQPANVWLAVILRWLIAASDSQAAAESEKAAAAAAAAAIQTVFIALPPHPAGMIRDPSSERRTGRLLGCPRASAGRVGRRGPGPPGRRRAGRCCPPAARERDFLECMGGAGVVVGGGERA
jgi:hypothetical protein